MTQINGVTIPDEGQTIERIPDTIGGHLYTVTTTVTVQVSRLDEVQQQIAEIQSEIDEKTALLAELQSTAALLPTLEVKPVETAVASSTAAHL